jgi:CubicO group peptidase (beta-lactamase class C family)
MIVQSQALPRKKFAAMALERRAARSQSLTGDAVLGRAEMDADVADPMVKGRCDARFEGVRQAFVHNFATGADVGASVAVTLDGELVVDLWGGHLDEATAAPWREDTIVPVFSTTKTMLALCALLLADRGELDFDAPVSRYWPQFASNGKEAVLVRHLLGHTSGLPGWDEPVTAEDLYDWEKMTGLLAAQAPWWAPGTASAYHAITQGYLVGDVVRRITGQTLGTFLAAEITGPLGADFHIGLDPRHDHRVSPIIPSTQPPPDADPGSIFARIAGNPPTPADVNRDPRWRRTESPAGNGYGNARSVAQVQALLACGGVAAGRRLMSRQGCEAVYRQQCDGVDLGWNFPVRWGLGLALELDRLSFGPRAVFWGGSGGSLIVVDLERRMTVAYVMNRMVGAPFGDPRNVGIAAAAYAATAA